MITLVRHNGHFLATTGVVRTRLAFRYTHTVEQSLLESVLPRLKVSAQSAMRVIAHP